MDIRKIKNEKRARRQKRIRAKVSGTQEIPRLAVFKSLKFIYAQAIDDVAGKTIAAGSSKDIKVKGAVLKAKAVGKIVADLLIAKGIKNVVFDRGGFLYSGQVAGLADGAREAGLKF